MPAPKTAAAWKKAKTHSVMCPSGTEITVQIPNLAILAKTGQIPNSLISAAVKVMEGEQELTPELLADQWEFYTRLILATVVEPSDLTESDVADLPYEDVEMIVEIASRQRDLDAEGKHIGGLDASEKFRKFRGLEIG